MKISWTRRNRLFAVLGGVVVVLAAVILVFTFVGTPGGGKLFGTSVSGNTIYQAFPTTKISSSPDFGLTELILVPYARSLSGFVKADGTVLNISSNTALYSVLGTKFGGNGRNTFALPNYPPISPVTGLTLIYYMNVNGGFPESGNQTIQSGGIYYFASPISNAESLNSRFIGEIILAQNVDEAAFTDVMVRCDGRAFDVNQYAALYSIIGPTFGGDVRGSVRLTFRLPDLSSMSSPISGAKYYMIIKGMYPN
jgi:microcystin-dependent protein